MNNKKLGIVKYQKDVVEFVDYTGDFPNLCGGDLILRINGEERNLGRVLRSGGSVWFENGDERVEDGAWGLFSLPDDIQHLHNQILNIVNEYITPGCCGGCV